MMRLARVFEKALRTRTYGRTDGKTDGQTDGRTLIQWCVGESEIGDFRRKASFRHGKILPFRTQEL